MVSLKWDKTWNVSRNCWHLKHLTNSVMLQFFSTCIVQKERLLEGACNCFVYYEVRNRMTLFGNFFITRSIHGSLYHSFLVEKWQKVQRRCETFGSQSILTDSVSVPFHHVERIPIIPIKEPQVLFWLEEFLKQLPVLGFKVARQAKNCKNITFF